MEQIVSYGPVFFSVYRLIKDHPFIPVWSPALHPSLTQQQLYPKEAIFRHVMPTFIKPRSSKVVRVKIRAETTN